ncbi:hypothetical protein ZEAMMB73_Zm00001d043982 [Zea mays]|uniref:Uncharacterized protein n=1 Tax=Zea mays TaxID=4577 RepID=A0A1D6NGK9_MAIZE|nr:hypothetical protein ZEAMMB73_Zm00001d043982 [Zea mays]ONM39569.1 hypothetical protein ZEAMMB73_Zm00001d043982 [Zea mays]ONM39571.1 hypothetical protein ZEAMMB73_Zm00001d043982 [Zea mays]ONM39572.1 hypothetical protein ZEAMMB73_Zm00001d043982 [Zea mays]ONM39573.1 hypothetical protein ZEAMMB73_Zm00001d043982 [Zea mays]|eukprot:XP_020405101.1 uncharacterized protein LOC100216618 isoform X6 [Zea mays]
MELAASSSSSAAGCGDLEVHDANDAPGNRSYLMNKARAFLELFFAMWFVMGNVWVFDARLGSFQRAPRLYALCVSLLAWNTVVYSLTFLSAASALRSTGRRRRFGSCRAHTCFISSAYTGGSGSSPLALSASKSSSELYIHYTHDILAYSLDQGVSILDTTDIFQLTREIKEELIFILAGGCNH